MSKNSFHDEIWESPWVPAVSIAWVVGVPVAAQRPPTRNACTNRSSKNCCFFCPLFARVFERFGSIEPHTDRFGHSNGPLTLTDNKNRQKVNAISI